MAPSAGYTRSKGRNKAAIPSIDIWPEKHLPLRIDHRRPVHHIERGRGAEGNSQGFPGINGGLEAGQVHALGCQEKGREVQGLFHPHPHPARHGVFQAGAGQAFGEVLDKVDMALGGDGADTVRGGQGDDSVSGGAGNDWLWGDKGNDTLSGGAGADSFHSLVGAGLDRITDFNRAEGDRLILDGSPAYTVSQVGADTVVDLGHGDQVVLVGVTYASLSAGWIVGG